MRKNLPLTPPAWKSRIRKEIRAAGRVLILGVGNPARGDDAAGPACAGRLHRLMRGKARSGLKILRGFETPENRTGEIRKFNPGLVLIFDSAQGPFPPGAVFIVEKNKIENEGASTHRISLALLVSYLEKTIGCRVIVLGIQPLNLGLDENLSGPVEKSVDLLARYFSQIFLRSGS
jgi:hydrogenase 3 maturation protease